MMDVMVARGVEQHGKDHKRPTSRVKLGASRSIAGPALDAYILPACADDQTRPDDMTRIADIHGDPEREGRQAGGSVSFSTRVQRRYDLFWRKPRFSLHTRGLCQRTYLSREDPLEKWHCCPFWQRKLSNKWNSREFAQKLGCAVPELYWSGSDVDEIPFGRLPDQFVVRSAVGHSRQAVLVLDHGRNLFNGERYDPARIREAMRMHVRGLPRGRLLVEEFIVPERGAPSALPRDYKFHVFGDQMGSIAVIERGTRVTTSIFDDAWNPLPKVCRADAAPDVVPPRPACFDEMRAMATTLGTAFGSYVRVDLYAGPRGALFGEFAATPNKGRGFTAFGDRRLGDFWARTYPDRV